MIGRTRPAASEAVSIHLDERTLPNPAITGHILDLFFKHFACRFPFLSREEIDPESPQYPFLFHSIASLVARSVLIRVLCVELPIDWMIDFPTRMNSPDLRIRLMHMATCFEVKRNNTSVRCWGLRLGRPLVLC